ncbi:MAG: Asp-tRNA(Asn)/Glu-tRNA(Gln) amidotransferase subunit GatB [Anaerolineales bacterium]|nr:Asp-tRNA(Asn)/Glu-tRNA(Gln) amidotransferase subunit GatB [Anaerolineales bacterium]
MPYEAVIGLEIHAELATRSKMFCACPVVDTTVAAPNTAVCPVCAGMPGTLPVVNAAAVEYGLRVALALGCQINPGSIFARKNYFYPDLPKGYQISQYEEPLARNGRITIRTSQGEKTIRIRRVHLEEDTGKLTHAGSGKQAHTLVDLNRAGVPLLEIVTEPDFRSGEEVRIYAQALRSILRYLEVNSGDMQKGVMRIEPNISIRPAVREGGQPAPLGTRVEVKNLNSFRALERATNYEIQRQAAALEAGEVVHQVTVGWDDAKEITVLQRVKEGEDDYRYFPEPDLQPVVVDEAQIARLHAELPELPEARFQRFCTQHGLTEYAAGVLVEEKAVADYFEAAAAANAVVTPKALANWISGELFGLMNQAGVTLDRLLIRAEALAELVQLVEQGKINQATGREVLGEMFRSGKAAGEIVRARGLEQVSDADFITGLVGETLAAYPQEVADYRTGKETLFNWLFGQVMRKAGGRANPQVVRQALSKQLKDTS